MTDYILDASAWLAFILGEPGAPAVRKLLNDGSGVLTSMGFAEVVDHMVRHREVSLDEVVLDLAEFGMAEPIAVDGALAMRGALLRAAHYHRARRAVSLADCVAAAAADRSRVPLVTSDPHLLDLCDDEQIELVAIAGSSGAVWTP